MTTLSCTFTSAEFSMLLLKHLRKRMYHGTVFLTFRRRSVHFLSKVSPYFLPIPAHGKGYFSAAVGGSSVSVAHVAGPAGGVRRHCVIGGGWPRLEPGDNGLRMHPLSLTPEVRCTWGRRAGCTLNLVRTSSGKSPDEDAMQFMCECSFALPMSQDSVDFRR